MIGHADRSALPPPQRADIIYAQARAMLSDRLWQAAVGTSDGPARPGYAAVQTVQGVSLDSLIAMMTADEAKMSPEARRALTKPDMDVVTAPPPVSSHSTQSQGLGPNAAFNSILSAASARTGIPAAALAAIVNAEAAKDADGRWRAFSRNPRSSAAGLGQFLSGTWKDEAQRPGTWLNGVAQARGWLDEKGKLRGSAKSELLAMRYDPEASIQTIADYARTNLTKLRDAGVAVRSDVDGIAQAAYLGHHLGIGDAIKFLNGSIDPGRARRLLDAQVGSAAADRRIAAAGTATQAHRAWLTDYVQRHVQASRYAARDDEGTPQSV